MRISWFTNRFKIVKSEIKTYFAKLKLKSKIKSGDFKMNTVKFEKGNAQVVAHRGLSGLEPENTVSAFVAAGNRSYFGAECDVHVTTDGKFIVIHDSQTGRVAEKNINVDESTFEEVRMVKLDNICGLERKVVGANVHYSNRSDLVIPEMKEYINICKKYGKKCVLELKDRIKTNYIEKIVEEIKELGYLENVIFISFNLDNLVDLRKILPNQKIQYLVSEYSKVVLDTLNKYKFDLDIHFNSLTKNIIDEVHANGHIVNCWTVDNKEDGERLASWGVDQITTNILE